MAEARQEFMGGLVAWAVFWVRQAVWADQLPGLAELNPFAPPPPPPSEAKRRRETKAGFKLLERALFGRVVRPA